MNSNMCPKEKKTHTQLQNATNDDQNRYFHRCDEKELKSQIYMAIIYEQ